MPLLILQRFLFAGVALIWIGLFTTQVLHGSQYRRQAEKNRIRLVHLPAPRGSILDRHGIPLVEDRLSFELAVFPQELKDPQESWARLTPVVGIPASQLAARYRRRYQAPFSPVPLVQDLPAETAFLLEEKRSELAGTGIRPVPRRHYSLGSAGASVCGYLGLIAPEELTHLKPYGYSFRDFIGKDGLERTYDPFLRGRDGGLQVEVDSRGRMVRQLGFLPPRPGRRITISLDGRIQSFCHRLLGGNRGAIGVMNASTGELLALASSPSYDPNDFVSPVEGPVVRRIFRDPDLPSDPFGRSPRLHLQGGGRL
jgi:penicillin-binding protein 2